MTPTAHLLLQESSPHDIYVLKATAAKIVAKESIRGNSNLFYIVSTCATSFYLASMGASQNGTWYTVSNNSSEDIYVYINSKLSNISMCDMEEVIFHLLQLNMQHFEGTI